MQKTWLYSALALTLFATACGYRSAAPDTAPQDTTVQSPYNANSYSNAATQARYGAYGGARDNMGKSGVTSYGTGAYGTGITGTPPNGKYGTGATDTFGMTGTYGGPETAAPGPGAYGFGTRGANNMYGTGATGTYGTMNNYGALGAGPNGTGLYGAYGRTDGNNIFTRSAAGPRRSMYQTNAMNTTQNNMPSMGYARTDKSAVSTYSTSQNQVYVDRNALAKAVADVTCSVPGVNASTVLVTDEEVFVGLRCDPNDAQAARAKARMNAMSVSPRYYKVYMTDDPRMTDELTRVASRTTQVNATLPQNQSQIDSLIKRFGGTTDSEQSRMGAKNAAGRSGNTSGMGTASGGTTSR